LKVRHVTQPGRNEIESLTVGEWTIRPALDRLERGDKTVAIEPGAMEVLVYLACHAREVVATDRLISELWHGKIVEDSSVYKRIAQLRHALGDDAHHPQYIETIPKHGYRLIAPVKFPSAEGVVQKREMSGRRVWLWTSAVFAGILLALSGYLTLRSPNPAPSAAINGLPAFSSLAVLPFVDLSEAGDQTYLGDGLAEHLIHVLSNIPNLRVAARTSAFTFKDGTVDIATIGERLNVDAVIEGSVQREDNQLRVTVQLIEAKGGYHVWSKIFDREYKDLLAIQAEIATAVAEAVAGNLPETRTVRPAEAGTLSIDAYDHYLLGRRHLYNRTESSIQRAISFFLRAIAIDPDFALAHAGLADAYLFQRRFTRASPELVSLAESAVKNALAIDDALAEAHAAMGNLLELKRDLPAAEAAYRRAIKLNPNFALAHFWLSIVLNRQNRPEDSAAALHTSLILDPLSAHINSQWAGHLFRQGQLEEAVSYYEKAISLNPAYWLAVGGLVDTYYKLLRYDKAIEILQEFTETTQDSGWKGEACLEIAGIYFNVLGDYQSAQQWIERAAEASPGRETNRHIHLLLARDQYGQASELIHHWAASNPGEPFTLSLAALYEMVIGHENHARRLYEQVEAAPLLVDVTENNLFGPDTVAWGYLPAVHYAHILMKSNQRQRGMVLLEQARSFVTEASECWDCDASKAYILGSIRALEGDKPNALKSLRAAIDNGWQKHWFLVRDPNMEPLKEDPEFKLLAAELAARIDQNRTDLIR
jgi:TolB-like protein/DNA-binding winged helix-turn-helix (wHTH) protein/Tfp pilus assembly protein PilF